MSTIKISELTEKATMVGTEEVLINDSGTSKKFSTQRFLDVKADCETSETNAAASAVAAAASAASADAVYDSFDDRYLGNKTSDPALDNDGNALVSGALYFNTTTGNMMVYDGAAWITTSSAILSTLDVYKFTATAGQTIFTGTDDDSNTLSIKPTAEIVVLNGVILEPTTDYTVTTTTLTLTSGATLDDEVNVYAFGNFELADHYSKSASDARYQPLDTVLTNTTASYTTAEETKLAGIETGATADQTKADIDALGIDAETLDGIDSSQFLRSDTTDVKTAGALNFSDNVKANFGNTFDLQIYHDGSKSLIAENGTGNLTIRGTDIIVQNGGGTATYLNCTDGGAVSLRYNNATKLATTATGVNVTGTVDCDGLTVDTATTNAVTIDGTGAHTLYSYHDSAGIGWASGAGASFDNMIYFNVSDDSINFYTGQAHEMKLEADGDLHVDGDVVAYSTSVSDERLKTDIKPIENALDKVSQLNGCTFTYTTDGKESAGLIAQDVEKVLPSAVSEKELPLKTDDGKTYKVLQYDQTIGLLVEAVKELTEQNKALTARVEELEAK